MTHPIPDNAHLLTIDEACEALGIGRTKTYELVMSGELPSIKIGSRRLIAVTTIAHYIRDQLREETSHPLLQQMVEDLIEAGELLTITQGDDRFVSLASLDAYTKTHGEAS